MRTDGQDMTKLTVAFRNFPKAPTNGATTNRTERRRQGSCDQNRDKWLVPNGGRGLCVAERPADHGVR